MYKYLSIFAALALLVTLGAGCKSSAPDTPSPVPGERPAPSASVDEGDATAEDLISALGTAELPENFPADVAIYPEVTITEARTSTASNGGAIHTISLAGEGAMSDAFTYYNEELENDGWYITTSRELTSKSEIEASKGNGSVMVTFGNKISYRDPETFKILTAPGVSITIKYREDTRL